MPQQTELAKMLGFNMPQAQAPAAAAPVEAPKAEEPGLNEKWAQAILAFAPILAGAAVGGARGGAIGAEAGLGGLGMYQRGKKEEQEKAEKKTKEEKELAQASIKQALEVAKEQRATAAEQRAEKREERAEARQLAELGFSKEKLDLEKKKLGLEMKSGSKQLESLSPEDKITVMKLSDDSAKKLAISNEIAQTIKTLDDPKISQDQKIKAGEGLLKVLNSTQGSDAVGEEESRRLGSLLQYQIFNVTGPGPMFGRDVEGFRNQAALTVNRLGGAIATNKQQIANAMAGKSMVPAEIPLIEKGKTQIQNVTAPSATASEKPGYMGPTVRQNGVTYQWNEAAGRYE